MIRASRIMVTTLLLVVMLMSAFETKLARAEPKTWIVDDDGPADFHTIQQAINSASDGDTVFVRSGTYLEAVFVKKAISLTAESSEATVIDPPGRHSGITVEADGVSVRGFTVEHADIGIWVKSSRCLIENNSLIGNLFDGIFLDGRQNTVEGNFVTRNRVLNNSAGGITGFNASDDQITYNDVENNWAGIFLYSEYGRPNNNSIIQHNKIRNNEDAGIVLDFNGRNCLISYNEIDGNGWEGKIFMAGISLDYNSDFNRIIANNITNNKIGIELWGYSNNNTIYHNSFIGNEKPLSNEDFRPSSCTWDDGVEGNYWSSYTGSDVDDDGIGDQPYFLDERNVDRYPLMKPYVPPLGDLNGDGKIDTRDIGMIARAFGSYLGCTRWNPIADVNHDNVVDLRDVASIARNFGKA